MGEHMTTDEPLLTPAEVADLWNVCTKTVARWANAGRLTAIRTPGGTRRFLEAEVRGLLQSDRDRQRAACAAQRHPDATVRPTGHHCPVCGPILPVEES
jgi:excisionase family DNA binding protein